MLITINVKIGNIEWLKLNVFVVILLLLAIYFA